jgi:hypothetical protein
MKSKEYVSKYSLSLGLKSHQHNDLIKDLSIDFIDLLKVGNAKENFKGFNNAVNAIRMKWDGINKKTVGSLPEKLWNYFYAAIIIKTKEELFPKEMEAERQKRIRRQKEREWEDNFYKEQSNRFFDSILNSYMAMFFSSLNRKPIKSFETLDLPVEGTTSEDVNKKFKQLAIIHHPDKGGDHEKFIKITEAKNTCVSYLNSL